VWRFLHLHRYQAGLWILPRDLRAAEIVVIINHLADGEHVAAATWNQALNSILWF